MAGDIPPRPIKRILVANRGEIATRILSASRELGLETVATYTDNDIGHVLNATHAVRLDSPASYTDVSALVAVARAHDVDAVHPGYGFLSESAELAARMADEAGVMVIGPGAGNLARTGDKLSARRLAEGCGVPVLAALAEPTGEVGRVRAFAEEAGLPVMVKAVDGGGGRGIRLVRRMEDVGRLSARAIEESPSRRVFAERAAVEGFRHVEVQIVGDGRGNVMHLWERECSIQRRYQKVVELAPSTVRDRAVVRPVIEAAVKMAREVNYASLGTFEFLLNPDTAEYFFLEINPRLQVEHTITESMCSTDIVKAQLRLAQGATFEEAGLASLSQDPDRPPRQHSIQLRLTAEDPEKDYSLSIGKIQSFHLPSGAGVRVDSALVPGAPAIVSSDFDSVIAKIIVTAPTWPDAIRKAQRALEDTSVTGVKTNLSLLRAIVAHPSFLAGECDTQWLETRHSELLALSRGFAPPRDPFHGLLSSTSPSSSSSSSLSPSLSLPSSGGPLFQKNDAWQISLSPLPSPSPPTPSDPIPPSHHHLQLTRILRSDFPSTLSAEILYSLPSSPSPQPYTLHLSATSASASATMGSAHRRGDASDPSHLVLPLSGKLVEVLVEVGDHVGRDEAVCVVRQMKMEVEVRSARAGRVCYVTEVEDGEDVAEGLLVAIVVEGEGDKGDGRAKL